jgi:hypothetical protein
MSSGRWGLARFYLDGVEVDAKLLPPRSAKVAPNSPNAGIWLARVQRDVNVFFRGRLQEIALYDRPLDPEECEGHFLAGSALFEPEESEE